MTDVSSGCTLTDVSPALGRKVIMVETANTVDTADEIPITLKDYGITTFLGVIGFIHSTEDSIVIQEQPTTAVSSGVLTITIGGTLASDQKRVYIIYGK